MVWRSSVFARRILRSRGIAGIRTGASASSNRFQHNEPSLDPSTVSLAVLATATATFGFCGAATIQNSGDDHASHGFGDGLVRFQQSMAPTALCESSYKSENRDGEPPHKKEAKLKRKKTALKVATNLRKMNTREEISKLRLIKDEMLRRWERDEDGWRDLPARAWPEYQPNSEQLEAIVAEIQKLGCNDKLATRNYASGTNQANDEQAGGAAHCYKLLFDMATGLVFYNVDPEAGFALYEKLAKQGHTPSMVACGIILIEGLGVPPQELQGFSWLEKAMASSEDGDGSAAQAMYELGTVYYTGIDGVVEEDPEKAFALFERAARLDHTAALYMVADCLVEGEGTERSVAKAVPLFYKAAERGHRYSRQRIRELLARVDYPL